MNVDSILRHGRAPLRAFAMASTLWLAACGGAGDPGDEAATEATSTGSLGAMHRGAAPTPVTVTVPLQALADDVDVPNPDRGFYRWAALDMDTLTTDESVGIFEADARNAYDAGYRVLYARVRLDDYRVTTVLPAALLNAVRSGFGAARRAGVKLVLRFVYNDGPAPGESLAPDAPLATVLAHLGQLRKQQILSANVDAIAYVQAGFIGAWGEWHSSSNHLTDPDLAPGAMAKIRDAIFAALPADQFVQLRNPQHMIGFYPTPPLPGATGQQARTGLHNDCFLASDTDVGSYAADPALRAQQRAYIAALGQVAPFGAETCWPPEPAQARTSCDDILAEGKTYALSYLNDSFYLPFIDGWKAQGCFDRVKATMGYRVRFTEAAYTPTAARGGTFNLRFSVSNTGWARIYKARGVRLVLRHQASGVVTAAAV
jgi:hypothetical protein